MDKLDRNNIDARHWAEQFCQHKSDNDWSLEDIDYDLMIGWFSNYRFAVADPLTALLDELREVVQSLVDDYSVDPIERAQLKAALEKNK